MEGPFTLVPSQTVTATGNSGALAISVTPNLALQVTVTAASGTSPSMTLAVQWSNDGTNFGAPDGGGDTFTAITAAGTVAKLITPKGRFMQLVWTITGTSPSFTFSVIAAG